MEWTWRRTLIGLCIAPTKSERLADLDGYSSLASRRLPHYLGALAAVVALASIAGRIGTVTAHRRQRRRRSYA